jgi:hypothetical protein
MPSTISLLTDNSLRIKPREAWVEGTNIRTAVKHNPEIIRGWIMAEVGRLIKDVDANKTISSNEELNFCCRSILEEHPTLKLEELRACFNMVRQGKFGKLFERLKSAEILEFIRQYEGEVRTEVMKLIRAEERSERFEKVEKLEPLNLGKRLADILNDDTPLPKPKGQGLGSRLKKKLGTNE